MGRVYIVGVGPGSPDYLTERARQVISRSDIVVGYKHSLDTVRSLLDGKDVRQITLKTQEEVYADLARTLKEGQKICAVTFTGDPDFSESEIVDRLIEIFGDASVEIVPGVSSVQVAASRSKIPIDRSVLITFHITGSIEREKELLLDALRSSRNVIMLPRPWDFMPVEVAGFLRGAGIDLGRFGVEIYEYLTLSNERVTRCRLSEVPKKEYSDLCVMVIRT